MGKPTTIKQRHVSVICKEKAWIINFQIYVPGERNKVIIRIKIDYISNISLSLSLSQQNDVPEFVLFCFCEITM